MSRNLTTWSLAILMLGCLILGGGGCSKSTDPKPRPFVYPLTVGNEWVYETIEILEYLHGDVDTTARAVTTVTITGVDSSGSDYRLTATYEPVDPPGVEIISKRVYQNRDDGLVLLANCGTVSQYPKRAAVRDLRSSALAPGFPCGLLFPLAGSPESGGCNPLIWLDSPALILAYPLEVGRSWLHSEGPIGAIDRVITGTERVRTDAGSFDCFEIAWHYENLESLEVTDYFAEEGLIRRRAFSADMVIPTYENPFGGDTADVTFLTTLLSVSLAGESD